MQTYRPALRVPAPEPLMSCSHGRAVRGYARLLTAAALGVVTVTSLTAVSPPSAMAASRPRAVSTTRTAAAVPGSWSTHLTAGSTAVRDASGTVWSPTTTLIGGAQVPVWGGIAGTTSEALYKVARQGATTWTVNVPGPARYAVDLLMADANPTKPGERVFDVTAQDGAGTTTTVASAVDIVRTARGWWAHHVTGIIPVTSGRLVLRLVPRRGAPLVSGLAVTTFGPLVSTTAPYVEDFSGAAGTAAPSSDWTNRIGSGPWGGGELEAYINDRRNSAQDGAGSLVITARKEPWSDQYGTRDYSSARLDTKGKRTFTYGTVEARMQVPSGKGLWPALWSLGADIDTVDWPRSGELDLMEHIGDQPSTVFGHLHSLGDSSDPLGWHDQRVSDIGGGYDTDAALTGWHTYSMEVTPAYVTFKIDGTSYFTATRTDMRAGQAWPIGKPYYLVLNLAVGGDWPGSPDTNTPFPSSLRVDRVSIKS